MTSIELNGTRSEDRFEFSPLRDSTSTSFNGSVTFDPFALIRAPPPSATATSRPDSPDVPDYTGGTMAVDLTYTLLGMTRFAVRAMRDVQYSFDVTQPYYVQTGIEVSVAQQIFGPVDVVFRLIEQRLAYRDRAGVPQIARIAPTAFTRSASAPAIASAATCASGSTWTMRRESVHRVASL